MRACLAPRDVSRPKLPPPPDACDTHADVFGPAARFPYADDRSYTPPDAPLEKYLSMLDGIGFARGVLVQGSALASAAPRLIIPLRGHFMKHWFGPIRNGWSGVATGRIDAARARCPTPDTYSNCFGRGRRTARPSTASSSAIPQRFTGSRTASLLA